MEDEKGTPGCGGVRQHPSDAGGRPTNLFAWSEGAKGVHTAGMTDLRVPPPGQTAGRLTLKIRQKK